MSRYTLEEKRKCLEENFEIPMSSEMEEAMKEVSNFCEFYIEYGKKMGEIKGIIRVYHDEMHLPDDVIIRKIRARYNLSQGEAEQYLEQVLKLQKV